MIKLGIDFDNTLLTYDSLFCKAAKEKNLIPSDFGEGKTRIRNYLREKDKEESFTLLQGEVYGLRISEATPSDGMFEALKTAKKNGIELFIVSHKAKTPYLGPKYDLHNAAKSWLEKNFFFDKNGINILEENVFFEVTKEEKIDRIESIGCTHFIDDLPEILEMINPKIKRILYNPNSKFIDKRFINMSHWLNLINLLN